MINRPDFEVTGIAVTSDDEIDTREFGSESSMGQLVAGSGDLVAD